MEYLPEHNYLKFHADTLEFVRKSYNLDKPGEMDNAIDILEEWIKQQKHFVKKDFDRNFLERIIIGNKGSIERTKRRLDKLCTARTLMPQYFGVLDMRKDFGQYFGHLNMAILPKLTKEHYRVLMWRSRLQEAEPKMVRDCFRLLLTNTEYITAHDYCNGLIVILNVFEINWSELLKLMNITQIKEGFTILSAGYETRAKGIHILSKSKLVDVAINVVKQFVTAKIASRIHVHNTIESLYEHVPKEILPLEYGGEEEPLDLLHEKYIDVLSSDEHKKFKRDMINARTDESLRPKDSFNEMYAGMTGTFRSLSVD